MSLRTRGVVACALLPLLGSCGAGDVALDSPTLAAKPEAACRAFVAAVPETLAGQDRRTVTPTSALGAAWGDPAITVTCGVGVPASFDEFSSCTQVNGVGWFVPADEVADDGADVTFTAVGFEPRVALHVPATYRPEGGAAALAELAAAVHDHLTLVQPCQ